ncbi:MAG: hypothetical protein Q9187_003917, partial [Circinaria calcarea]
MGPKSASDDPTAPTDDKPKKTATGAAKPETGKKPNNQDGKKSAAEPSGKVPENKSSTKRPADGDPKESSAKKQKFQGGNECGSHRFQETNALSNELQKRLLQRHLDASNFEARFVKGIQYPDAVKQRSHFSDLTPTTVILAIAAVWRGLDEAGVRFSFGDLALFSGARTKQGPHVSFVSPSSRLIMPLFFRQGEAENDTDYHALVIAEQGRSGAIRLLFMCSHLKDRSERRIMPTYPISQERLREAAQNIVRNSGWIPQNVKPDFRTSSNLWINVPHAVATTGVAVVKNTSAYQVVLNAWAYMLDIPIHGHHGRNVCQLSDPLYVGTLKLINLALDGRMDSQTIRCFLLEMEYGLIATGRRLSKIEDANERQNNRRVLDGTRAFLMNDVIFGRLMEDLRASPNQARAQGISTASLSQQPSATVDPMQLQTTMDIIKSIKPLLPQGPQPGSSNNTDWMAKFEKSHGEFVAQMEITEKFPLKIGKDAELTDTQIFAAIGAIWRPLWNKNIKFSFATSGSCILHRTKATMGVENRAIAGTGGEYPLILPLLGHGKSFLTGDEQWVIDQKKAEAAKKKGEEKQSSKTLGHYVLIIADRLTDTQDTVRLRLWDSLPTYANEEAIWNAASTLVRQIGWLDYNVDTNKAVVADGHTIKCRKQAALIQHPDSNTCGLLVVLNAGQSCSTSKRPEPEGA